MNAGAPVDCPCDVVDEVCCWSGDVGCCGGCGGGGNTPNGGMFINPGAVKKNNKTFKINDTKSYQDLVVCFTIELTRNE